MYTDVKVPSSLIEVPTDLGDFSLQVTNDFADSWLVEIQFRIAVVE